MDNNVKIYTPPLLYTYWWAMAQKEVEPPVGLIQHDAGQLPRNGVGEGRVLAAATIPLALLTPLKFFVSEGIVHGGMVHERQDVRTPNALLPMEDLISRLHESRRREHARG